MQPLPFWQTLEGEAPLRMDVGIHTHTFLPGRGPRLHSLLSGLSGHICCHTESHLDFRSMHESAAGLKDKNCFFHWVAETCFIQRQYLKNAKSTCRINVQKYPDESELVHWTGSNLLVRLWTNSILNLKRFNSKVKNRDFRETTAETSTFNRPQNKNWTFQK